MDLRPILLMLAFLVSGDALAQAYRWVDADGVVHYSDRPPPETVTDAEEFELPKGTQTRFATRSRPNSSRNNDEDASSSEPYTNLEITSPSSEETLWNIGETLNVSVAVTPRLKSGHRLRVYFDGEPTVVRGTSFRLDEVYRGTHNLQVEVIDNSGNMLIRSPSIRFYVQQNSVITPANPAPGVARRN